MSKSRLACLVVGVAALGLLLTGCQSVATSSLLTPPMTVAPNTNPGGAEQPGALAPHAVQLSAKRAAPHAYVGSFGGPVSGPALGSQRPCPGTLMSGLVLMLGKTQVAAVFICPVTKPGNSPSHYTGAFQQVPANRVDALLKALSYSPTMPQSAHSCVVNPPHIDVPLVVLESRSGIYYDVPVRQGECPGMVPDDIAKAIDVALAPVTVHSVPGVRGYPTGPIDLGKPCDDVRPVHKGPFIEAAVPAITAVYVCPQAPSSGNTPRYYKTVPDSKTAALLRALAGPDDHPSGPFWNCAAIISGSGYAVIGQAADGTLWRVRVPTAGCEQPTIAVGKAIDAAIGTHRYDKVMGYGL